MQFFHFVILHPVSAFIPTMSNTDYNGDLDKLVRDNTPQQLRDKLETLGQSTNGTKKAMAKRLLECSAATEVSTADEELQALR